MAIVADSCDQTMAVLFCSGTVDGGGCAADMVFAQRRILNSVIFIFNYWAIWSILLFWPFFRYSPL
jgi:hypothetical protein